MLIRRFKLIYLPEGSSKKREFNIEKKHWVVFITLLTASFLILSTGTAYLLNNWFSSKKISTLTFKNSKLEKQLRLARDRMESLSDNMDRLSASNNELRAYAHLPGLDPEMLKMGIGGALPEAGSWTTGAEDLLSKLDLIERQIGLQENTLVEVKAQLDDEADLLKSVPSIRPVRGGAFSSLFGNRRDPLNGRWEPHMGVDINAAKGSPVYSAADGVVIHADREPAYGNIVVIDHGHGYRTRYAHLSQFYVTKGQRVERGDTLGAVGSTGRTTGPHLHYEVLHYNQNVDPLDFMFEGYQVAHLP